MLRPCTCIYMASDRTEHNAAKIVYIVIMHNKQPLEDDKAPHSLTSPTDVAGVMLVSHRDQDHKDG